MDVIAVTLFFSLLLAGLFFLLFFVSRSGGKSPEQESLLPLAEDANAGEGRGKRRAPLGRDPASAANF